MSIQVTGASGPSGIRRYAAKAAVVLGSLALVAAMTVPGSGTSVERASADAMPLQALFGTVVEVSPPDQITVATDSGVVTVYIPGNEVFSGDINSVESISEGDRIIASVQLVVDGATTADTVLVVPDLTQTVIRHILGVILDRSESAVIVQDRDGNSITIDVPEGVDVPDVGTVVTAVAQLDRATGRLQARAFDRVEDAVQRLQDAKDNATDADLKEDLEDRLERARDQHLSALERAREALERAQQAVEIAISEKDKAQEQLAEVQARFDALRQRYVQEANDRNERLPELRTEGTLAYEPDVWLESSGTFTLTPRLNDATGSVSRVFAWDENTLAIVPVEVRETDPSSPAITVTTAQSIALPLNQVKSLIPSGSRVTVQHDPNQDPPLATLITVLPPELPTAVKDALERERLRSISGFITLVEETPALSSVTGVAVVANREHDVKVAVKVTEDTEIEIDGDQAKFSQLAAGMAVEVEFAAAEAEDGSTQASLTGRLDALRIRARTTIDNDEVYVAGVISGLDSDTRAVGILTRDGSVVRAQVLDDAVIIKNGAEARFAALEVGDLVLDATRYNRGTLVFTRLVVQSPREVAFTGSITGLDRNPRRVSVSTAEGRVLVAFITSDTDLFAQKDGSRLTFSDLAVGDYIVKGAALPVQRDGETVFVASELVIGQPVNSTARGVVARVDAAAGALQLLVRNASSATSATNSGKTEILNLEIAKNGSSVLIKNDERVRDLQTVNVGDIVESVSYVSATNIIVKMTVSSPNLQRTRGAVDSVSGNGLIIQTNDGKFVALTVDSSTRITVNGVRVTSLRPVTERHIVIDALYLARSADIPAGLALSLVLVTRPVQPGAGSQPDLAIQPGVVEATVAGVIQDISDDGWTIGDRKFIVNSSTTFFGERPQEGLIAKATLVVNSDGQFVATSVSVAGRPDTNPSSRPIEIQPVEPGDSSNSGNTSGLVRILGKVQSIAVTSEGNEAVMVDGVRITILPSTVVVGEAEVGANALAVVRRSPSGNVSAVTIIFTKPRTDSPVLVPGTPDSPTAGDTGDSDVPAGGDDSGSSTTPAEDDGSDSGLETGSDGNSSSTVQTTTIIVEEISGRIVVAEGRYYLVSALQALSLKVGAEVTLRVKVVQPSEFDTVLSLLDRLAIASNPLYQAETADGVNPLYVAQ